MNQTGKIPDFAAAEKDLLANLEANLSPRLSYHNIQHTKEVMDAAMIIAASENVSEEERRILRIAVAFHDSGFLFTYDFHEEKGCELAKDILPKYGFSPQQVETVCQLIMATQAPQKPKTKLERIICDADLDYLGREGAEATADNLFEELKQWNLLHTKEEWINRQINFLSTHHYFTAFSIKNRENKKQEYFSNLTNLTKGNHS